MSRVELYERIRKDSRDEGLGIRALAERHHVHRRAVRQALASATPPPRKVAEREAPALGPWTMLIRAWLVADREAPRKQRHTARRVHQRLVAEYGANVAESTVRAFVAQVNLELDNSLRRVTVPQTHGPGEEAEVDFGEFMAFIDGVAVKCWMFRMRLSHSGRGFHVAFSHQAREAFFEGHVSAFAHFGAVPGRIRYDNLKAAVAKVLMGRDRTENERFVALRSHYGFDSFYCIPGIDGAHEKGGVEGEVGRFRRRHLVPVPRVATLGELNELLAAGDVVDDARHIARRPDPVGVVAAAEVASMAALPEESFDSAAILGAKVDTKGRVSVRQMRCWLRTGPRYTRSCVPLHLNADIEASYRRFVERVADGGCWVLVDEDEHGAWVESDDAVGPDGEPLPVHLLFSDRAYAQRLARDEWKGYSVISLPPVLLEMVLVDLRDRGERVGCNFTADLAGVEIEPERLRRDLVARG